MKTRYILPALLALSATVTSTQAMAEGMTYDPYENYYSTYYGIGEKSKATPAAVAGKTQAEFSFNDPYADYYNTYYGMDGLLDQDEKVTATAPKVDVADPKDYSDMSDPTNYYKW